MKEDLLAGVCEGDRVCVCVRERECVCARERESVCERVCVKESVGESV